MSSPPVYMSDPSSGKHVDYTFNSKIMVAAMVILFVVVLFVVSLHIYAKWFWRHGTAASRWSTTNALHASWRRRRRLELVTDDSMAANTCIGLDPSTVNSLPTFIYEGAMLEAEPLLECAVCLSEFQVHDNGRILPNCKHSFHIDCIDVWFRSRSTCPLCRTPVLSTTTHEEHAGNTSNQPAAPSLQISVSPTMHQQHTDDEQNISVSHPNSLLQNADVSADPGQPLPLLQSVAADLESHRQLQEQGIANSAGMAPPLHPPSHSASMSCASISSYGEFLCKDAITHTSLPNMGASGSSSARVMLTETLRQPERVAIARSTSLSLSRRLSEEAQECSPQPQKLLSFRMSIKRLVSRELSKGRSRVFPSGQVNVELEQSTSNMNSPV